MSDLYIYRKQVRRHWYAKFRLRWRLVVITTILLCLTVAAILIDLARSDGANPQPSLVENIQITDTTNTFKTAYFQFQDSGKWVLNKRESNDNKFVYYKYRGVQPQYQLIIYRNQVPIPLYLATSRVLPVRIVNSNSLDITNVYGPCVSQYKPGDLHKVKTVTIQGAKMLCDPDTPQFSVVVAEVDGDWRIKLQRHNGTPVTFVITFRDLTPNPGPDTLLRVADSFQSL